MANSVDLKHRDVLVKGQKIHVVEAGEGPPLLLVHGFLVSHKEWLPILPYLTPHFRCIVPDLPGFGASDKKSPSLYGYSREAFSDTLVEILTAFELPRVHVCGHSMGGSISITFAADHPEMVQRLVLMDSLSLPFDVPFKGKLPLLPFIGPIIFKKLYGRALFRDYFKNDVWSGHAGFDPATADAYFDDFDPPEAREAAYATLLNISDVRGLVPRVARVKAQTLVLWGSDDRIFPVAIGHRLAKELPSGKIRVIEGVGHAPNEEAPETTAKLIVGHLSGDDV